MHIKQLKCLNLGWTGSFKLGITAIDEIQTPRDQSHSVVSVSIFNESKQYIFYHISVSFDSCRRSTAEDNTQVHSFLVVKECIATVSQLSFLVSYLLINANLAIFLSRFQGLLFSQFTIHRVLLRVYDVSKLLGELFHHFFKAALIL